MSAFKFLVLAFLVTVSSACKCLPQDARRSFCSNEFFGLVTILEGPTNCGDHLHCYQVRVDKAYKGSTEDVNTIETSDSSASCGRSYVIGKQYVATGSPVEGHMFTNLCSYPQPNSVHSDLAPHVKAIKESTYESLQQNPRC